MSTWDVCQTEILPDKAIIEETSQTYQEIMGKSEGEPSPSQTTSQTKVKAYQYSMIGHVEQCVDK